MNQSTPTLNSTEPTIKTNEVNEQQIIDTLFKERDTYQQTNKDQRSKTNEIYTVYMGNTEEVQKTSQKTYFKSVDIPKMRTEIAYIVPFIFSGNPEIEVEGIGDEDKTIAQILEKIVNFRFQTIPSFYEKVEAWVKQSVTFGTSLLKVIWKFETKDNGDGTASPIKDEPDVEVPNILDCFYNPIIPSVENQPSLIFRSVIPVEEVRNNPLYDFENDSGLNRELVESKDKFTQNEYDSSSQLSGDKIEDTAGRGTVEIYERVTKDRIQTVADGTKRLVLRDKPWDYGFINAIKLIHEPNCIPNRFDGLGVGFNTLGLSKGFHSLFNQTKYNVTMCNNPMFLSAKGAIPDKKQAVSKPGGIVEVALEDGESLDNKVKALQFPDIKQGAVEVLNKFDDEHKRASGANDLVQGAASNKTLGQDNLGITYSSNRFELIQRRFKQALSDVAYMMIKMELKNLQSPDSPILRIFPAEVIDEMTGQPMTDELGQPINYRQKIYEMLVSEEAQNCQYNIRIKGDTTIAKNKDFMLKEFREWLDMFINFLPPQYQMAAGRKWLEMRGIDEVDSLVPDPQEYAAMMEQQQMQEQQLNSTNEQTGTEQPTGY